MNGPPGGSKAHQKRHQTPERTDADDCGDNSSDLRHFGIKNSPVSLLSRSDPLRQAKRLPIRVLKMLTAHSSHLLHPEYLQPLTSAPISIELDAKKSPLALLAQTCSQIGKPDPPPSTKLGSLTSSGLGGDKEAAGRSSGSALKLGEPRPSLEDKSSFKPYSKLGGECRKEGGGATDKAGFRLAGGGGGGALCGSFAVSPSSKARSSPSARPQSPAPLLTDHKPAPPPPHPDPAASGTDGAVCGGGPKKEADPSPDASSAHAANSAHARASANASSGSSASSPRPLESGKPDPLPPQPGHVAPVSPFKPAPPLFPLAPPSSGMGYHGSIVGVGAYAGYPSPFAPGLDHAKSGLVGGGVGPAKHPSSSPLGGASPPAFMQGLCRDPYCLSYPPSAPHLGGAGGCSSCAHHHDPSSSGPALKSPGFPPLVYPSHTLHALHAGAHPLYASFLLPNEPLPHACNWVSAGGPCDKRFGSSEELLAHLRTHTALPEKLLSAYPSPASPFSLRAPPAPLGLARYHPYGKVHLPALPSLPPAASPYYSPYALYTQRLASASALGYP